jgi:hypothetical protein
MKVAEDKPIQRSSCIVDGKCRGYYDASCLKRVGKNHSIGMNGRNDIGARAKILGSTRYGNKPYQRDAASGPSQQNKRGQINKRFVKRGQHEFRVSDRYDLAAKVSGQHSSPSQKLFLPFDFKKEYKSANRLYEMSSQSIAVRMLFASLATLLLCVVINSELPELLSLTDNTTNDFTMSSAKPLVLPVLYQATDIPKRAKVFRTPPLDSLFSCLSTSEKAALVPSVLFILYSVLRT